MTVRRGARPRTSRDRLFPSIPRFAPALRPRSPVATPDRPALRDLTVGTVHAEPPGCPVRRPRGEHRRPPVPLRVHLSPGLFPRPATSGPGSLPPCRSSTSRCLGCSVLHIALPTATPLVPLCAPSAPSPRHHLPSHQSDQEPPSYRRPRLPITFRMAVLRSPPHRPPALCSPLHIRPF